MLFIVLLLQYDFSEEMVSFVFFDHVYKTKRDYGFTMDSQQSSTLLMFTQSYRTGDMEETGWM